MNMRIAFTNLACPAWSIEQVIAAAEQYGYDGVELRLLGGDAIDPARDRVAVLDAVNRCRVAGIDVCALDTSCRFNQPDAAERARQIEEARRWIALAQEARVAVLRVFGGADEAGASPEDGNSWVAEGLNALAGDAEAAAVRVALETHDAFSAASRVAQVLAQAPSPAIGALWDSHHPYRAGESPQQVLDLLGPRLVHAHVKDARRHAPGSEEWDLVLLGEGEVPVREMLRALARHGYGGWVAVEWEKKWHPEIAEPEVALPQHSEWLRRAMAMYIS
jgi:fatty-acyl-CoA synthase